MWLGMLSVRREINCWEILAGYKIGTVWFCQHEPWWPWPLLRKWQQVTAEKYWVSYALEIPSITVDLLQAKCFLSVPATKCCKYRMCLGRYSLWAESQSTSQTLRIFIAIHEEQMVSWAITLAYLSSHTSYNSPMRPVCLSLVDFSQYHVTCLYVLIVSLQMCPLPIVFLLAQHSLAYYLLPLWLMLFHFSSLPSLEKHWLQNLE